MAGRFNQFIWKCEADLKCLFPYISSFVSDFMTNAGLQATCYVFPSTFIKKIDEFSEGGGVETSTYNLVRN